MSEICTIDSQAFEEIAEAVFRIRATAMLWALNGAIPECGHFGSIAQDADWIVGELARFRPSKATGINPKVEDKPDIG